MSVRSFKRAHAKRLERERRRGTRVIGTALTVSALMAASAQAATYTVLNTNDSGAGSLRAAITSANADASNDTITFASGVTGTIPLASKLSINGGTTGDYSLSIVGPGAGTLSVSGGATVEDFYIKPTDVSSKAAISISGLTITGGHSNTDGAGIQDLAASRTSTLTLTNDTLSNNSTTSGDYLGGGVFAKAAVTITGSTITGNTAGEGGGGIAIGEGSAKYPLTITNSTISGNTAPAGGGLEGGMVSMTGSQVTGNHATSTMPGSGNGGGIAAKYGGLRLNNTVVSGNTAATTGGVEDGLGGLGGGIEVTSTYGVQLTNSTVSGNTSGEGGGIGVFAFSGEPGLGAKYNGLDLTGTTVSGNSARQGAGMDVVFAAPGTPIKILDSTISGNQGIGASFGGGLEFAKYLFAPVDVINSTISGNTATLGAGVGIGYDSAYSVFGGSGAHAVTMGLFEGPNNGSISFDNSTISGNAATGGGGGIYLGQYTVSGVKKAPAVSLTSTIVAGNTAAGAANDLFRPTSATTGGFNEAFSLIQTPGDAPVLSSHSVITGVSPQLGPLAANGGVTQTMLPAGTSPVIDQAHAPSTLTTDQRGDPRTVRVAGIPEPPGGDGTDIGSVEVPATAVTVPTAFTVSVVGNTLGGKIPPVIVAGSTHVTCATATGSLASCVIELHTSKGSLLGDGEATASKTVTSLSTVVSLTSSGSKTLKHDPLGSAATAKIVASTSGAGSQTVQGNVRLLAGPSMTIDTGSRSTKFSKGVSGELKQVAQILADAKLITCTAYTDTGTGDTSLTKTQAKNACAALKKDGFKGSLKSVGKGHSDPVASNSSSKGRKENRRIVFTFML